MKKFGAIVALTKNGVLGKDNDLPWPKGAIKGDLPHFKEVTSGGVVIYGRATFESMGSKPLPNRTNIIVSTTLRDDVPGVHVYSSLPLALAFAALHAKPVWFIGGANLLKQVMTLRILERIWITRVRDEYEGDVILDWSEDFLHENNFIKTSEKEISEGKAVIEGWGFCG